MPNTILTPDVIAPNAIAEFMNALNMVGFVDRQHSSEFSNKIGDSIRIKKRTNFTATDGADVTSNLQDIVEGSQVLQLNKRKVVALPLSTQETSLDLENFTEQVVKPAVMELAQQVESDLAGSYVDIWNQVGTAGTTPSTIADAMLPRTLFNEIGVPNDGQRTAFYEPNAASNMAAVLGGVFPTSIADLAITEGEIRRYAGFAYMENQSIVRHTVGAYAGTPLVNGASQNVTYDSVKDDYKQNLVTDGWTATTSTLKAGDRFTIAGVYSVNMRTRQSTGKLQTFVVKADVTADGSGNKTLSIAPPIITSGAFQTVSAAPADNAAITVLGTANTAYPQNMILHKNALTIAFANLDDPMGGGATASRAMEDGISIRVLMGFDPLKDTNIIRFDILYGIKMQNPGMAAVHVG